VILYEDYINWAICFIITFWGYGTLDLALGTFGTFASWGIFQILIVILDY